MHCLEGKEIEFEQNFLLGKVLQEVVTMDAFLGFCADMASNACRIGSSVFEFRLHDMGDLSERIAHALD